VALERHGASIDTPIFMAHGNADPVIPLQRAEQSRDLLMALGHDIEWHQYAMQHSLCQQEIDDIGAWLARVLKQ
jgi:phospholipase/carboxylesterase